MARLRFAVGTRYLLNNQVYIVRAILPDDKLQVENLGYDGIVTASRDELYKAWTDGDLKFEVVGGARQTPDAPIATEYTIKDFQGLPEKVRDEAWRRYTLIKPLLEIPRRERTRQAIEEYIATLPTPDQQNGNGNGNGNGKRSRIGESRSRASIERWLHAFEGSGHDIRSLVPFAHESGGKGKSRLAPLVEDIVDSVLAECQAKPRHRSVTDVADLIANRIADENRFRPQGSKLSMPALSTIYARIQKAGAASVLQRAPSPMESHRTSPVMPGPRPNHILQRVEIDHTRLDIILLDDDDGLPLGRPTFTYAIDVYSGMPYGFYLGFEEPSYLTVMQCLLHGILPKPDTREQYGTANAWEVFGLPENLIIDNGKEFIGRDLEDACAQLGIDLQRMPVRMPWMKGSIERAFGTINTSLVHKLPGSTFSNIQKKGDYDSAGKASITLSDFYEMLHIFLIDQYAQSWHNRSASQGVPAKLWRESIAAGYTPAVPSSADETRILLGRTDTRSLQRTGIDFESLRYQSPYLNRMRTLLPQGAQVRIKYDPSDMGKIYVYDPTAYDGRGEWLQIPALAWEYADGLSLWKHRLLRGYVLSSKREVNEGELLAAKAKWQAIAEREFGMSRKAKLTKRRTAARFLGKTHSSGNADQGGTNLAATPDPARTPTPTPQPAAKPKPARGRPRKVVEIPTIEPDIDDLGDEEGWGASYDLPHHGRRQPIVPPTPLRPGQG